MQEKSESQSGLTQEEQKLKGLRGWLAVLAIGLLASVFLHGQTLYEYVSLFFDGTTELLSDPFSELYTPGYVGLLVSEAVVSAVFLAVTVYLIHLFLRRSKKFPEYFFLFLIGSALWFALDYALVAFFPVSDEMRKIFDDVLSEQNKEVVRSILVVVIWGSYIKKSKRVKLTFVR